MGAYGCKYVKAIVVLRNHKCYYQPAISSCYQGQL